MTDKNKEIEASIVFNQGKNLNNMIFWQEYDIQIGDKQVGSVYLNEKYSVKSKTIILTRRA